MTQDLAPGWQSHRQRERVFDFADTATIVWNFDSVVLDNEQARRDSYASVLSARKFDAPTPEFYAAHPGLPEAVLLKRSAGRRKLDIAQVMNDRASLYQASIADLGPSWLFRDLVRVDTKQILVTEPSNHSQLESWGIDPDVEVLDLTPAAKRTLLVKLTGAGPLLIVEASAPYPHLALTKRRMRLAVQTQFFGGLPADETVRL